MGYIDIAAWRPVGVESLEDAADKVVRSSSNTHVVAGPGSGKTELLAQRACYLLQTGTCPHPKRILAISFKRDAARNLADRVTLRCGEKALRFSSLTLDSFAKSLVDRFRKALPEAWRPKLDYEVMLRLPPDEEMRDWLLGAAIPSGVERPDFRSFRNNDIRQFIDRCSHGHPLPYNQVDPLEKWYGLLWWRQQLAAPGGRPSISFPMLNRLAALVLHANPVLTRILRQTYPFVFLDEFQDTTSSQYDLVCVAFKDSLSVLTAVGDSKQRIMLWAGALIDVFDMYTRDFSAPRYPLVRNYRSAPQLVRIQQAIADAIEAGTPRAEAVKGEEVKGICGVLEFTSPEQEAQFLAGLILRDISQKGLRPRDFCILARQRTAQMILPLQKALRNLGIRARDESQLQDLLTEPVAEFVLAILKLVTRARDAEAWNRLLSEIAVLQGWELDADRQRVDREAKHLVRFARDYLVDSTTPKAATIKNLGAEILKEIGDACFRSTYRQYARGSFLHENVNALSEALASTMEGVGDFRSAVDEIGGINVVPAMTIHKSKGLEFHTIVFLGLEDSSWWSFASQPEEEKRSFFVAFSRAIQRVLFTFSDERVGNRGRQRQQRNQIGDLYNILQRAGVPISDARSGKSESFTL